MESYFPLRALTRALPTHNLDFQYRLTSRTCDALVFTIDQCHTCVAFGAQATARRHVFLTHDFCC